MKNLLNSSIETDYLSDSVEVVKYTGKYPCLCMGTLVLYINGKRHEWAGCLQSGGTCSVGANGEEFIGQGAWRVSVPFGFEEYLPQIQQWVDNNVPQGCCGGCI